jgi:hypothetical protein
LILGENMTFKEKSICIVCSLLIAAGANFLYLFLALQCLVVRGGDSYVFVKLLDILVTPFIFAVINAALKAFVTSNKKLNIALNITAYLPFSILCLLFFITPILDFIANLIF